MTTLAEIFGELCQYFECMQGLPPRAFKAWARELTDLDEEQLERMADEAMLLSRGAAINPRRLKLLALDAENVIDESWQNTLASVKCGDHFKLTELSYSVCKTVGILSDKWRFWDDFSLQKIYPDYKAIAESFLLGEKELFEMPLKEDRQIAPAKEEPMTIEQLRTLKEKAIAENKKRHQQEVKNSSPEQRERVRSERQKMGAAFRAALSTVGSHPEAEENLPF